MLPFFIARCKVLLNQIQYTSNLCLRKPEPFGVGVLRRATERLLLVTSGRGGNPGVDLGACFVSPRNIVLGGDLCGTMDGAVERPRGTSIFLGERIGSNTLFAGVSTTDGEFTGSMFMTRTTLSSSCAERPGPITDSGREGG